MKTAPVTFEPTGKGVITLRTKGYYGQDIKKDYSLKEAPLFLNTWRKAPETYGMTNEELDEFALAIQMEQEG